MRLFIFLSIFVVFADSISYENNEILTRNKCIYKTDYCRILLVQQIISSLKQARKISLFKGKQNLSIYFRFRSSKEIFYIPKVLLRTISNCVITNNIYLCHYEQSLLMPLQKISTNVITNKLPMSLRKFK